MEIRNEIESRKANINLSDSDNIANTEINSASIFDIAMKADTNNILTAESEYNNTKSINIDGKIEETEQGHFGDCWLLAGLNALSYNEKGAQIIKNAISDNKDGTYSVTFGATGDTLTYTEDLLKTLKTKNPHYAKGDDDVILLEIAVNGFLKKVQNGDIVLPKGSPELLHNDEDKAPIDGGYFQDIVYMLTGETTRFIQNKNNVNSNNNKSFSEKIQSFFSPNPLEEIYNRIEENPQNISACIYFTYEYETNEDAIIKDIHGNKVVLTNGGSHAWSIKSVQGNNVTMVNPWNASQDVVVSKKQLEKYATGIDYYEYEKTYYDSKGKLNTTNCNF